MKKLLILMLACLSLGCSVESKLSSGEGFDSDELTAKDLEPTIEARQFFSDPNCVVWNEGFPLAELKKLTNDLYSAGSPKVMFADVSDTEGKKLSAWFVAQLPKDKAARDRCFAVWNKVLKDTDSESDPKENKDQEFLDLALD